MDITKKSNIQQILSENGIAPLKKLGQNFLCDKNIVEKIASAAADDFIVEIGPGLGALTCALSERAQKVVAIEIDGGMVRALASTLAGCSNAAVIHADFLKTDIGAVAKEHFGAGVPFSIAGNLPYYITSKCLLAAVECGAPVRRFTAMVQKEVADRLSAEPGSRTYGALTASLQYYGKTKTLFDVSADCFLPRPDVDSAVIQLAPSAAFGVDRERYSRAVRGLFSMRRKTVLNNMKSTFHLSGEAAQAMLEKAEIDVTARAEALSPADFARLAAVLPQQP